MGKCRDEREARQGCSVLSGLEKSVIPGLDPGISRRGISWKASTRSFMTSAQLSPGDAKIKSWHDEWGRGGTSGEARHLLHSGTEQPWEARYFLHSGTEQPRREQRSVCRSMAPSLPIPLRWANSRFWLITAHGGRFDYLLAQAGKFR
jgi:hypothetical protein